MSRAERIRTNSLAQRDSEGSTATLPTEIQLPEIPKAFEYLLVLFYGSGQALSSGMGIYPLTWEEIESYIRVNELSLTLYEKEILKKMSEAYCAEYSHASDPKRPSPYQPEKPEEDGIARAMRIMDTLSAFRKN